MSKSSISSAIKFGNMLRMLPEWNNIISYDARNKHIYFHDVTNENRAASAQYYSKFLYEFRGDKYGRGRVLGTVYEHHYEYAFKTNAQTLQVWQNGKVVYQCSKKWLINKTREIRYRAYMVNKYGVDRLRFPAAIAPHRAYQDADRQQIKKIAAKALPPHLFKELLTWPVIKKSPYSFSFYNAEKVTWSEKPEGSLRISDHWNFYSRGEKHCITEDVPSSGWAIQQYNDGLYHNPGKAPLVKKCA